MKNSFQKSNPMKVKICNQIKSQDRSKFLQVLNLRTRLAYLMILDTWKTKGILLQKKPVSTWLFYRLLTWDSARIMDRTAVLSLCGIVVPSQGNFSNSVRQWGNFSLQRWLLKRVMLAPVIEHSKYTPLSSAIAIQLRGATIAVTVIWRKTHKKPNA